MEQKNDPKWTRIWSDPKAIRTRLSPQPTDPDYLALKDLCIYLKRFTTDTQISVLDYGAGASPYRSFFKNSDFKRADYVSLPELDYRIDEQGNLNAPDDSFDLVWSTQVAEHVCNPDRYFQEAIRVLKPGGKIVISTHGTWEEHGTPYDFQRWTAAGLIRDLEKAGFTEVKISKITCSDRAHLAMFLNWIQRAQRRGNRLRALILTILQPLERLLRPMTHWLADKLLSNHCCAEDQQGAETRFYLILAAEAQKPDLWPKKD